MVRRNRRGRRTVRTRRLRTGPPVSNRPRAVAMIPRSRKNDDNEPHAPAGAGPAGIVRRAFGHGGPDPQEELERVLRDRRAELEEYAARFEETARELSRREERLRDERASVERLIRRSTAELEARETELVDFERELRTREERLSAAETDVARRRGDLGAVELKRAALERRERALDAREAVLASTDADVERSRDDASLETAIELLFVPGAEYRLLQAEGAIGVPGTTVDVEGEQYAIARIGRSPLPRDARRCAYLVRGTPREPGGGSL